MSVIDLLQMVVLVVFTAINGGYAASLVLASRTLLMRDRRSSALEDTAMARAGNYLPVSFLVPAYNEEATIVASIRSLLAMHYPGFEVIVVSDGSSDGTMAVMKEAFDLVPSAPLPLRVAPHAPLRSAWRSRSHPNLIVLDKENGGKADALNAALEQAHFPVVAAIDADSLVDPSALLRAGARFHDRPDLVALGGTIRVVNDATEVDGAVREARTPRNFLARWQQLEYVRAFLAARTALSHVGCLMLVSGAFGLFRRGALIEVGGYRTDTVGEDFELGVRLHRHFRDKRVPYAIEYMIEPLCWTQVPEDAATLRRQRDRWHRGLWETLWAHRAMLFNPRYGRIGMIAVPHAWFFEGLAPLVEVAGYLLVVALAFTGNLEPIFAAAFFALAILYGVLVSLASGALEIVLPQAPSRLGDRIRMLNAVVTENLGYRPWLAVVRTIAMFTIRRRRGTWGVMTRKRFG